MRRGVDLSGLGRIDAMLGGARGAEAAVAGVMIGGAYWTAMTDAMIRRTWAVKTLAAAGVSGSRTCEAMVWKGSR